MRFTLLVLLILTSRTSAEPVVLRGATMGTTYQIKAVAVPDSAHSQHLHAEVKGVLAEIDRQMSTYREDSELSRFNRAPTGQWFPVSAGTARVVGAAQEISQQSGGALDVTVGPLVRLWQFGPPDLRKSSRTPEFKPPSDQALAAARKHVDYQQLDVHVTPPGLRKKIVGLEVDLSSIAPGYAVDCLAELLVERRIKDFMVEIGGEVRAAGRRADGSPWRVAIAQPTDGRRAMHSAIPLIDAAVATAGDYQKFFEYEGRRYSHVIDPATGRPVEHALASVTVVADTCIEADGWDTPLLVLGPQRGFEVAERHGLAALFLERSGNEQPARATTAWQARFGSDRSE